MGEFRWEPCRGRYCRGTTSDGGYCLACESSFVPRLEADLAALEAEVARLRESLGRLRAAARRELDALTRDAPGGEG